MWAHIFLSNAPPGNRYTNQQCKGLAAQALCLRNKFHHLLHTLTLQLLLTWANLVPAKMKLSCYECMHLSLRRMGTPALRR